MTEAQDFLPIVTPHSPALEAAVAQVYRAFGRGHVSPQLEVCLCPVCMTEDSRQQFIAQPTDALSIELIRAYSHSAHGVPQDLDDLRLILPRYLDWIAQDELVDDVGVSTELLRFGDAVRAHPALFTAPQRAALDVWAERVMWHFGWAEARALENIYCPVSLIETLVVGGWDVGLITGLMDQLIADADIGPEVLAGFLRQTQRNLSHKRRLPFLDWFALSYVDDAARAGLAAWLNSDVLKEAVLTLATDQAAAPNDQVLAGIFALMQGQFTPQSFPQNARS